MELVSIIIIIIVLVLVIVYVTRPLFIMQDETAESIPDDSSERTRAEYNAVLERIHELDFDFNLGKLTTEEHTTQREEFLALAANLRRQLQVEDTATDTATS